MAINESHLSKNKKQCSKMNRLANKKHIVASHLSSGKPIIVLGGVVHVQIRSTRKADGGYDLNLKKVASRTKNSYGVFVAGGTEVDKLVASANASVSLHPSCVVEQKRKLSSLKEYFIHRKP